MKIAIFYCDGIWYLGNEEFVETFSASDPIMDYIFDHLDREYILLAQTINAPLIREMFLLHKHNLIPTASIMTYRILPVEFNSIETFRDTFSKILQQQYSVGLGGQRPLQYEDFCFSLVHTSCPNSSLFVSSIFSKHLMWIPARFFRCYNDQALAFLLGCIGDPRWHVIVDEETGEQIIDLNMLPRFLTTSSGSKFGKESVPLDLSVWFDPILFNEYIAGKCKEYCPEDYFTIAVAKDLYRNKYPSSHISIMLKKYSKKYVKFITDLWLWVVEHLRARNKSEFPFPKFGFPKRVEKAFQTYLSPLFSKD